jgi:hypothetical protein
MAYALALSLKHSQHETPYLTIAITPGFKVPKKFVWAFDNIIEIPWGDSAGLVENKIDNEWKAIHITPYEETIKVDCDMLFFTDMGATWELLADHQFYICNNPLTYRNELIVDNSYRTVFSVNKLPDVYSSFMYFNKSSADVHELFKMVELLFEYWEKLSAEFLDPKTRPEKPTTDIVFALAIKLLDLDQCWYNKQTLLSLVDIRTHTQDWHTENMTEEWNEYLPVFMSNLSVCRLGNHIQTHPLHYHIKNFLTDEMIQNYEHITKNSISKV